MENTQTLEKEASTDSKKRQFCTFWIFEHLFGVDILDVKEVNSETDFTPVFHAPKEVKGYINIRGQIHLILDLRLILGFESKESDNSSKIILFKQQVGESFGILVDRIGDVVEVDEAYIEKQCQNIQDELEIIKPKLSEPEIGICKLKDQLLVILDAGSLLKRNKISV